MEDYEYISLTEAAKLMDVTRQAIFCAIKIGRIKAIKDDLNRFRVNLDSLDNYRQTKYLRMHTIMDNGVPLSESPHGFITLPEAVKRYDISYLHLYWMIRHGNIEHATVGNALVLKEQEMEKYAQLYHNKKQTAVI